MLAKAADTAFRGATDDGSPTRHARALANLLTDHPGEAVTVLTPLADEAHDAAIWNDLAAARYTEAVRSGRLEDLAPALAAVDTALRMKPDQQEARFNRALIVERLGIRDPAINAWKSYLDVDGGSEWAVEARSRLQALSVTEPQFADILKRDYNQLVAHPEYARDLARKFPQEARVTAETEILARWAEAKKSGDEALAAQHLALAESFGAEVGQHGERIVERAVAVIAQASGAKQAALVNGQLDFRNAQKIFRSGRPGEAEPLFRQAAQELRAGGSPVSLVARFFAAYLLYEMANVQDSTRELEVLLAEVPDSFLTCRARVQWQLSINRGAEGRWGDAIDLAQASMENFEHVGEMNYAAIMAEHLAEANHIIGDPVMAWKYQAIVLPVLGKTSTRFLQSAVLGSLSLDAVVRRDWPQALSFTELELEVGKTARYQQDRADAYLRMALIHRHIGGGDPGDDIARARAIIAAIPDAGMRSRFDVRRVAIEAIVARSPAEAVPLLTTAINFHGGANGQRMFLPALLLHRAQAQRALAQPAAARRDLDAALVELDSDRTSLKLAEQRAGIFESSDDILDEAIDLALHQGDVEGAFSYAEHARARTLLDALRSPTDATARPVLPAGTTLLEYTVLPSRVIIFVADRSGLRAVSQPVNREDLRARVAEFGESLSHNTTGSRTVGPTLYRDLIAPVKEWIAGNEKLVIVPDAATSSIPFAALPVPDGHFLIEKHVLVSAPSAAVYVQGCSRQERGTLERRLLLVVNDATGSQEMEPLRSAGDEARHVSAFYRDVRTLSGKEATRAAFIRESSSASIIHFAGHALSSEYRPEETSIVLTGADGRMNVTDIARLQLRGCSTVVLAGCSTARGKVRRYEGTFSVARAFLATGVPSVVATLWPIEDSEAARFFPRLHEQLVRGYSTAESLRMAQVEAIRSSSPPALWAAIQVIGS